MTRYQYILLSLLPILVLSVLKLLTVNQTFNPIQESKQILLMIVVMPILEEIFFRGLLQDFMKKYFGIVIGAIIVNIFFVIAHYHNNSSTIYLMGVGCCGLIFSYVKYTSGKLTQAILFHSYFNLVFICFTNLT